MTSTTPKMIATAAAVLAALTSACTNKQPPAATPATSRPAAASPTTPASIPAQTPEQATQAAVDAYIGLQNAFLAASRKGDPDHPDLAKYATGDALALYTKGLKSQKAQGLLGRGQAIYHPKVTMLAPATAPTKATVQDCMDTSATSLYKANGDPYQDTPGGLRLVFADVERLNGIWKVTSLAIREVGSCTG
jgi:hypothetical protein